MVEIIANFNPFEFSIEFNPHHGSFETIQDYYDKDDFVSEEEYQKSIEDDKVFCGRIYPNNSVGFYIVCAHDYGKVFKALHDIMIEEGKNK